MRIEFTQQGIYLPEIALWLDPRESCEAAWVSHAHGDHAQGTHCRVICTPETAQAYKLRLGDGPEFRLLRYHESVEFAGAKLTAYPAGHILGAAQLLIEHHGERMVYTGDLKLKPPLCGAETETVPCDRLIIESTFGLPIFFFISREEARARIVDFARECLDAGLIPAFLAYPLGRGQEVLNILCEARIPTAVHGAIARNIPVYEAAGFRFPGWEPYENRSVRGKAFVTVPGFRNILQASEKNYRIAYVSGWAAMDNARGRTGAEVLIPYSDHAGFDELLEIVERSGAREVDVVHGYAAPFARILAQRGIEAQAPNAAAARETDEAEA